MLSNFFSGLKAAAGSLTTPDANDAPAPSPSRDLPPFPFSRHSPPAPTSPPSVIDLSSPTKPPTGSQREEQAPETSPSPSSKPVRSEDEKRLTGDYEVPADATHIPHPSTWMAKPPNMFTKPGANKRYKPVDTLNDVVRATKKRPTTYGKHARPRPSLIGQSPGPGQTAYSEFQRSKAPATPSRRILSREEEGPWDDQPASAKRRKTHHIIDLANDEDGEGPAGAQHRRPSDERPLSARSSQSRLSVGSGSAAADFKPFQATNEFREVDNFLRPNQKKPRQPSYSKTQDHRQNSPFGSGTMAADPHTLVLLDFQQGEPSHRSSKHEQRRDHGQPVTSKHFPKARINESTTAQSSTTRAVIGDGSNLRTQHRPVPIQVDRAGESDSPDELAISPTTARKQIRSPSKAKKGIHSSIKTNGHSKDSSVAWPLLFARSYDFEGTGSKMDDGHATLVLRPDSKGLRVQKYDAEGYETVMPIDSQHVNKVHADCTSRIRLEGPRDAYGNVHIFDLRFLHQSEFLTFRNTYAIALTATQRVFEREEEHMCIVFARPLTPRNDKVKTSEASIRDAPIPRNQNAHNGQSERQPLVRMRRPEARVNDSSIPILKAGVTVLTRPSRSRPSPVTQIIDDDPDVSEVPKYSIDHGLGRPWAKTLEYGEGRQRAIVHFDDLPRLDEEEYLNDSLIDFYMIYLFQKHQVPADKVYFFNTYFFTRLTENAGRKSMNYKAVERWTSKIDIFSYDYIVVPINDSQTHWYLAIICNVSNIQRKPVLEDFDESHSRARDQSETCTASAVASESEENTKPPSASDPSSPARVEEVRNQQEEDPNLFDEPTISLVDRDDTGAGARASVMTNESNVVSLDSETEPMEASKGTADADATSQGRLTQPSLSFLKNRNKRKPVAKKDPGQPVVVVLDSLGGLARSGAVRTLKDWVAAEGKNKRGMEAVIKENGYYPKGSQIPMQKNWTDCGVYLLGYVEKFFQNPDEFMHKLLTGSMSAEQDWPELNPSTMRHKMRDIIFECYKQQEEARKMQKKAKKGSVRPAASPDPAAEEASGMDVVAVPAEDAVVEEQPSPKTVMQREQHGADGQDRTQAESAILPPGPRLSSPFEPIKERAALGKELPRATIVNKAKLPSPISVADKSASATRLAMPPRRQSPEVRIPNTTCQSYESVGDARSNTIKSPDYLEPADQHSPRSSHANKRRRQDNRGSFTSSPDAKRLQKNSAGEEKGNGGLQTEAASPHDRKGGGPNAPIEIEDSQEMEILEQRYVQPLSAILAHVGSLSSLPRSTQALDRPPSVEEVPQLPTRAEVQEKGAYGASHDGRLRLELSEKEEYERDHGRRSVAPDPSVPSQASQHAGEGSQDLVELISQSTDQMQLDGAESGDVVRETPEPGRSPMPT